MQRVTLCSRERTKVNDLTHRPRTPLPLTHPTAEQTEPCGRTHCELELGQLALRRVEHPPQQASVHTSAHSAWLGHFLSQVLFSSYKQPSRITARAHDRSSCNRCQQAAVQRKGHRLINKMCVSIRALQMESAVRHSIGTSLAVGFVFCLATAGQPADARSLSRDVRGILP